jgi:hypothetical protein
MRLLVATSAALLAVAAACGDAAQEGTQNGGMIPDRTSTPDQTSATSAATTTTAVPLSGGDLVRCESPEGSAISAPGLAHQRG